MLTPEQVARAAFDGVNAHDPDAVIANNADDCIDDFVAVAAFRGKAEQRAFFAEMFGAFPDISIEIVNLVADDQLAAVQWHATATFTGTPFQGFRANGRRIVIRGVDYMEVSGGKLRHNTIYYDGAGFARQLGLLPSQGSRAESLMRAGFNAKTRLLRRRNVGR